jgi:hypothetical protein
MSDIGAVTPTESRLPADARHQPARELDKTPRRPQPRKPRSADEMIEIESHTLDLEA